MTMNEDKRKAYYHLPGLFEFYEFYKEFLPIFYEHREYFYDWCEIGSIYGAPADCLWGGGRVGFGDADTEDVLRLMKEYGISARLTLSNSLLKEEHLKDKKCNALCRQFENPMNGIIISSDLLLDYISSKYPEFYFISSTTKVITDFDGFFEETKREEFKYVVPDFRLNKRLDRLEAMQIEQKNKVEFLCNECCEASCMDRKACYENVSLKNLCENVPDHICRSKDGEKAYSFARAMNNPMFISLSDIQDIYLPMGFSNFKIEGRSLGSAMILEFILYYMTKPEYQIHVREKIYLSSSLDLF